MSNSGYIQKFRSFRSEIQSALPTEEFADGVYERIDTLPTRLTELVRRREEVAAFLRKTPAMQKRALTTLPVHDAADLAALAIGALNMATNLYEALDWHAVPLSGGYRENAAGAYLLACDVLMRTCNGLEEID